MKALLLSLAITATLAACATTTSPTGRRQYVGAVSQAELNQLGEQAFNELKQQKQQSSNAQQRAYVDCVVDTVVASMPADWRAATGATGGWENALFQDADANAFALPGGRTLPPDRAGNAIRKSAPGASPGVVTAVPVSRSSGACRPRGPARTRAPGRWRARATR